MEGIIKSENYKFSIVSRSLIFHSIKIAINLNILLTIVHNIWFVDVIQGWCYSNVFKKNQRDFEKLCVNFSFFVAFNTLSESLWNRGKKEERIENQGMKSDTLPSSFSCHTTLVALQPKSHVEHYNKILYIVLQW